MGADLAKVLEEKDKKEIKRERDKEKKRTDHVAKENVSRAAIHIR